MERFVLVFLLTGIVWFTSGGGPYISVGILRPKFAVPFLTNRFFALIREFVKKIKMTRAISIGSSSSTLFRHI